MNKSPKSAKGLILSDGLHIKHAIIIASLLTGICHEHYP
jgi:hypothetical protein